MGRVLQQRGVYTIAAAAARNTPVGIPYRVLAHVQHVHNHGPIPGEWKRPKRITPPPHREKGEKKRKIKRYVMGKREDLHWGGGE